MDFFELNTDPPVLGLGMAALGRPGYINLGHDEALGEDKSVGVMEAHAHAVLDRAGALGIRYLDAARSYGKAEAFVASWLAKDPERRARFAIGSKWGYTYTADWKTQAEKHEVKEHSLAKLNEQWPLSRALLPGLSLYQIHSATFSSGVLENEAVHHRLAQLREEHGVAIGLSVSGVDQAEIIDAALKLEVDGMRLFDTVQATYNVLEQRAEPALRRAKSAGLKVIIKEGVANGRLSPANLNRAAGKIPGEVLFLAEQWRVSVDVIALAFILHQPFVDIVLSGAGSLPHLESNARARRIRFSEEEIRELRGLSQDGETYWKTRSGLRWN